MRIPICLGAVALAGLFVAVSRAQDGPKGKPPVVMKVVAVAADHLVVEHSAPVPGEPLLRSVRTYRPEFKYLRVFDTGGKQLDEAAWKKRVKAGLKVYVAADEKKVDPAHLRKAPRDALVLWGVVVLTPEPIEP